MAGVAVKHGGRLERVTVRGRIYTTSGKGYVGGVVVNSLYEDAVVISECANYASVTAGYHVGGIASQFTGTIEYCANYGDIVGTAGAPSMGGLVGGFYQKASSTYSNVYNVGTVSAPNWRANGNSQAVGGLWGFEGLYGSANYMSYATNIFSYGKVTLDGGLGAVIDGGKFSDKAFDNCVNFFYRREAGSRLSWAGGAQGDDGWGTDYAKEKVQEKSEDDFRNGAVLAILNSHETGKYSDGAARWVQDGDYPELWVFRQDLPKPAAPSTGGDNDNGGGDTDDGDDDSGGGNTGATTTVPVAGGNVTVPSDATVNPSTGLVTLPTGGEITLTDGTTKLIVPPSTTVDPATGIITVTQSGALTLADGATKLVIPPATTINAATGEINITEGGGVTIADGVTELVVPPATTIDAKTGTMTVTQPEGGIVELPAANLEIQVPSGSNINPNTGVITLPSGMVILPGQNGVIDTPGAARSSQSYARSAGDNDDLVFTLTSGATISPTTGIVTVRNGGEITLPDGSKRTVEPGSTINPITGAITPPRADAEGTEDNELDNRNESGSGGCETGLGAFALALLGTAVVLRKRVR